MAAINVAGNSEVIRPKTRSPAQRVETRQDDVMGGARAARMSMCSRMVAITRGSVITVKTRNAAPQRGHRRGSVPPREGEGFAATEAPRGLLWHHYQVDVQGLIRFARIAETHRIGTPTRREHVDEIGSGPQVGLDQFQMPLDERLDALEEDVLLERLRETR